MNWKGKDRTWLCTTLKPYLLQESFGVTEKPNETPEFEKSVLQLKFDPRDKLSLSNLFSDNCNFVRISYIQFYYQPVILFLTQLKKQKTFSFSCTKIIDVYSDFFLLPCSKYYRNMTLLTIHCTSAAIMHLSEQVFPN